MATSAIDLPIPQTGLLGEVYANKALCPKNAVKIVRPQIIDAVAVK